jgi:hypothetical protein
VQDGQYVLYARLLDANHQVGILGISTRLVQPSHQDNGNTAIVQAEVTLEGGRVLRSSALMLSKSGTALGLFPNVRRIVLTLLI